jgi:hypothetical protein
MIGPRPARSKAPAIVTHDCGSAVVSDLPAAGGRRPARQDGEVTVGYSGTPLARKLGVDGGSRLLVSGAPLGWHLDAPAGATVHARPGRGRYDVVLAFCGDRGELRRRFAASAGRLTPAGAVWIAWPKKSSGVVTDVDENVVRAHGLDLGLVDVKVCAIDATWSGLKFVRRLADR